MTLRESDRIVIQVGDADARAYIQARIASGEEIASDVCVGVWLDVRLLGWGDDYGTFHAIPAPTSGAELERAGERLLEAASELWALQ